MISSIWIPNIDWIIRNDDRSIDIVKERLQIYHEHFDPIINYFQQNDQLFQFTPYNGYDDIPKFQSKLKQWLLDRLHKKKEEEEE